ncbi:MAG TPA: hypothetical protein VGI60_13265 [Chthoniobacterales bacterium]
MKRSLLALLLPLGALTSCQSMHNAAVSTFRVVDAPHQYIRRELGMDEEDQPQTNATTTTTTEAAYPAQENPTTPQTSTAAMQPYSQAPPPPVQAPHPSVQTERTVASTQQQQSQPPPTRELPRPTAAPHVVTREAASHTAESHPTATPRLSSTPRTTSSKATAASEFPYAKPVPGKPGYVFSPFDPNGGYVDVTGYSPGQKVKDPYSGKIFLVP